MGLPDSLNSDKFKKIVDSLQSKDFEEELKRILEEDAAKSENKSELYGQIANHYFILLSLLKIDSFNSFRFPDYEDCRRVDIDGVEYDFDSLFHHDDLEASDALSAIDCLISDSDESNLEKVLKAIEKTVNERNQNIS